jgi:hypothetical protein
MFRRLHDRFGTAGALIAVIALIAALGGTAFAAKGALTGKQKKEVKAIAKSFQGTGPAGPQGLPGAPGAGGKDGLNGADGTDGTDGADGRSVLSTSFEGTNEPVSEPCEERGGVEFEVEGSGVKEYACTGDEGPTGDPWTAGGTLPANATEEGVWALNESTSDNLPKFVVYPAAGVPISFGIPLGTEPATHLIAENGNEVGGPNDGNPQAACDDGDAPPPSPTNPEADSGHLCVFAATGLTGVEGAISGVSPMGTAGALLNLFFQPAGVSEILLNGTWAVTG